MNGVDLPHDFLAQIKPMLDVAQRWLITYAILLARPLAMLSVNPIFTQTELSNVLKGIIATGLILPMWPATVSALSSNPPDMALFVFIAIKESLIGLALGLPLGLPFWTLLAAGDIIDQQRGATQGRLNDPAGFGDMSVTGMLFLLCGIAIIAITGRLDIIPETLYSSWRLWYPLDMLPMIQDSRAADLGLQLLDTLEGQAVTLGAPVILAMLLSDAAMMLLARIAPQLHVDDLSLAVRNLVFVIFMPLYAGFFLLYTAKAENLVERGFRILSLALHPSGTGVVVP
jgi:type III secretion protein T